MDTFYNCSVLLLLASASSLSCEGAKVSEHRARTLTGHSLCRTGRSEGPVRTATPAQSAESAIMTTPTHWGVCGGGVPPTHHSDVPHVVLGGLDHFIEQHPTHITHTRQCTVHVVIK